MAVAQVGALVSFVDATTIVHSDFNANFTDLRTAFNNLVTSANQLAGGITVNGALTVASGGLTITAGDLTMGTAISQLVPGATSFSIRNNADSANNLILTNTGAATFRSTVSGITTLTATTLSGTLSTSAQPNITSTGTLSSLTLSGTLTAGGTINANTNAITGVTTLAMTGVLTSTLAAGTAPFTLSSNTLVTNLNVDRVDDQHGSFYRDAGNLNAGTILSARVSGSYTGITGVGTLAAGAVPASLVTAGTFGTGAYVFDNAISGITTGEYSSYLQGTTGNGYLDLRGDSGASINLRLTDAGKLFLGDTLNAKCSQGFTVQQGAFNDEIVGLKNSAVTHARTSIAETDTFGTLAIAAATFGGLQVRGIAEDDASAPIVMLIEAYGGQAGTNKTSAATALITLNASEHNGSNTVANITSDGNVFCVQGYVGDATRALFVVDAEGELLADGGTTTAAVTVFDEHDDAHLIRAFDLARSSKGRIRSAWDEHLKYNEQALVDCGVLGAPIAEGGLVNITQLQRLHNGCHWQAYVERQEMKELIVGQLGRIEDLERKLLAA